MPSILLGVDVGGTFTDALALDTETGQRAEAKAATTPDALPTGVVEAAKRAVDALEATPEATDRIVHGTTVATNALLEDELARTALVTNAGFEDVLEIGRQTRPALYDLDVTGPAPIVPRDLRLGIPGRLDADGAEIEPVDDAAVDAVAERLQDSGAKAVAVCLLHAHTDKAHEARVADRLRGALGASVRVVASHEVSPEVREVERFTTTVVNAALRPQLEAYLERLTDRLSAAGFQAPVSVMDSAGGRVTPEQAAKRPVELVLSGPAGGVASMAWLSEETGREALIGIDMGGTSTDVSLVLDGEPTQQWETEVAGRRLQIPAADVHTVGAGGGSIAWLDEAGGLRVGPASAGADPGPACYGRGGEQATLTDANVVLGRVPETVDLGGQLRLDAAAARAAIAHLAEALGQTVEATAEAIVRIATAHAARGIRVLTARHAADPQRAALVAFGGAGPQFGAEWADRLGITTVLIPRHAGVRSAAGLLAAPARVERARSLLAPLPEVDEAALLEAVAPLEAAATDALGTRPDRVEHRVSARYQGQSHELTVAVPSLDPARIRDRFEAAHEAHHGYRLGEATVELVTLRARAVAGTQRPPPIQRAGDPQPPTVLGEAEAFFPTVDAPVATRILDARGLDPGVKLDGPAILAGADTTVLVPPGWRAQVDPHGHVELDKEASP